MYVSTGFSETAVVRTSTCESVGTGSGISPHRMFSAGPHSLIYAAFIVAFLSEGIRNGAQLAFCIQCFDYGATDGIAPDVHGRPAHVQNAIDGDDQTLRLYRQVYGLKNNQHHDQPCVRNSRRADAGQQCRKRDHDLLAQAQFEAVVLSDKQDGDNFIQRGAVETRQAVIVERLPRPLPIKYIDGTNK